MELTLSIAGGIIIGFVGLYLLLLVRNAFVRVKRQSDIKVAIEVVRMSRYIAPSGPAMAKVINDAHVTLSEAGIDVSKIV